MTLEERYGTLDRLLHRLAFRVPFAQRALADVEEALYRDRLAPVESGRPVFVTALPRSGTTILLELLVASGRFASHLYRDMPFVLCPMLWARFSRRFAVEDEPRERDHGDGLRISSESPEALEEMIWKAFWPDRYRGDRILPWTEEDRDPEFDAFFRAHMRKIVALRREGPSDERRYLSKNNLNVARLAAPPPPLAEGVFLVPFREPVQQAASLLRQHRRFTIIHRESPFTREYMEAIGHHEFGAELKPVDYGGWLEGAPSPDGLEFWIRYWVAAYRFVLEEASVPVRLVSYARLTERPGEVLGEMESELGTGAGSLTSRAGRLRSPREHEVDVGEVAPAVLGEAGRVWERLEEESRR